MEGRKVCRFVRQSDLFYEYLTVEEHLYYQAILRLGDRPEAEIRDRLVWVNPHLSCDAQIVKNFNLSKCLHVQLGGVHAKGISGDAGDGADQLPQHPLLRRAHQRPGLLHGRDRHQDPPRARSPAYAPPA